ncbi:MAG: signal peptidase I [Puniceicoccales bacterium]|jgi:signal peptidase I|nr:signal peptidase I [Puniceicoccales bacterium]
MLEQMEKELRSALANHGECGESFLQKCDGKLLELEGRGPAMRCWTENVEMLLAATIVAVAFRVFFFQTFTIPTNSMLPTYHGMHATLSQWNQEGSRWDSMVYGKTCYALKSKWGGRVRIPINDRETAMRQQSFIAYEVVKVRRFFIFSTVKRRYTLLVGEGKVTVDVPGEFDLESIIMERFFPKILSRRIADALNDGTMARRHGQFFLDTHCDISAGEVLLAFCLQRGDVLFVDRISPHFFSMKCGEAIVFATGRVPSIGENDRYYIKRLVAMPGDSISVIGQQLWRNGMPSNDSAAIAMNNGQKSSYGGYRAYGNLTSGAFAVPDGTFFVMGDNSASSYDSRFFGPIPQNAVIGRPIWVFYPKRDQISMDIPQNTLE